MIWLIGNRGMLGTEMSLLLESAGYAFVGTDREVDITSPEAVEAHAAQYSGEKAITWIINCAAYTQVDKAEEETEICRLLNVEGPANIAHLARKIGARLAHLSTDYVFDGVGTRPYLETDRTAPTGFYGLTKRDGETRVLAENPAAYIIRTAWLYGRYGNNFVLTMLRLMKERDSVKVVEDQRGSPTWARDLARTVLRFFERDIKGRAAPFGIYHYTDLGDITWYDFACEIYGKGRSLGLLASECLVEPCGSDQYPSKVKRPSYSVLDKTKIQKALGIGIPVWKESLHEFLEIEAGRK